MKRHLKALGYMGFIALYVALAFVIIYVSGIITAWHWLVPWGMLGAAVVGILYWMCYGMAGYSPGKNGW